jgi:hypothetical protein
MIGNGENRVPEKKQRVGGKGKAPMARTGFPLSRRTLAVYVNLASFAF